jgi:hypothetical protein
VKLNSKTVPQRRRRKKDVRSRTGARSPQNKRADSLPKIEPLPGAVCRQMVRCGRENCKCSKGELHGPFHYRFYYVAGKLRKKYVRKQDLLAVIKACSVYKEQRVVWRTMIKDAQNQWRELRAQLKEFER